jgi:glycosyltransferase involved in cell wall biosynthesis
MVPLLSIVIPTKNRYNYLKVLIEKIVILKNSNFELIVQDNSDDNSEFVDFVESLPVLYEYVNRPLSVVENCDLGVKKAKGKYICMIGDDDGILLASSLNFLKLNENKDIDCYLFTKPSFAWPDTKHAVWEDKLSGKVYYSNYSYVSNKIEIAEEFNKIIFQAGSLGLGKLPRLYHGFVQKSTLDTVFQNFGTYFPGPSPDMSSSVAISLFARSCYYVDLPLIISGHSKKSTGGQGGEKKHFGEISQIKHLPFDTEKNWCPLIPFFWSGPTIYSQSIYQVLSKYKGRNLLLNFNFLHLYAVCLIYEKHFKDRVLRVVRNDTNSFDKIKIFFTIFFLFLRRIKNFIRNVWKYNISRRSFFQADNIAEVIEKLEIILSENDKIKRRGSI